MSKEEIAEGILYFLDTPSSATTHDSPNSNSYSVLAIREFLKGNNVLEYVKDTEDSWQKLKNLLREMTEQGLVEEHHVEVHGEKRIGYSAEDLGLEILTQTPRSELVLKWKLP